jgi:transposase
MNDRRYKNYQSVARSLSSELFDAPERGLLRDAAEGMLLMRSADSKELDELTANVDAVLASMINEHRIDARTAGRLRTRIGKCGPTGATLAAAASRDRGRSRVNAN